MKKIQKYSPWIIAAIIFSAALFLRAYDINNIPAGIYPDEAVNGIDALKANNTGDYKLFYENNYGREGLFINLQALTIKAFGNTIFGLKFWSILFGALTAFGVFLLTKELFKSSRAGLIASYFTAFSYWAINFSRIGFRANMVPLILTFTFYFIFRGLRTKKYSDFILSGLIFGLGVHTYIAFRVSPLVMVVLLIGLVLSHENFLKNYWRHILVFIIAMLITSAPMLMDFFYFHPEHYASRTGGISVLNSDVNKGDLLGTLVKTFGLSLAKYNFWGDQNWRHNYPPYPILNPLISISFLIGLFYIIAKIVRLSWFRLVEKIRNEKLAIYIFLLTWLIILLIPEFLAYEGNPHALRAIGTIPVVFIIATIPVLWVMARIRNYGIGFRSFAITILLGSFIFIGLFDPIKYFVYFGNNPNQYAAFESRFTYMAKYLMTLPQETKKYIIANAGGKEMNDSLPVTAEPIKYLTAGKVQNISFLVCENNPDSDLLPELETPSELIMMQYNQKIIDQINQNYPNSSFEKIDFIPGKQSDFFVAHINK